jgi:hypothetical protein
MNAAILAYLLKLLSLRKAAEKARRSRQEGKRDKKKPLARKVGSN